MCLCLITFGGLQTAFIWARVLWHGLRCVNDRVEHVGVESTASIDWLAQPPISALVPRPSSPAGPSARTRGVDCEHNAAVIREWMEWRFWGDGQHLLSESVSAPLRLDSAPARSARTLRRGIPLWILLPRGWSSSHWEPAFPVWLARHRPISLRLGLAENAEAPCPYAVKKATTR